MVSPPRHSLFAAPREISTALRFLARHPTAAWVPRIECATHAVYIHAGRPKGRASTRETVSLFRVYPRTMHNAGPPAPPVPRAPFTERVAFRSKPVETPIPRPRSVTNNFYANFSSRSRDAPDVTGEGKIRGRREEGERRRPRPRGDLCWKSGTRSSSSSSRKIRLKSARTDEKMFVLPGRY